MKTTKTISEKLAVKMIQNHQLHAIKGGGGKSSVDVLKTSTPPLSK